MKILVNMVDFVLDNLEIIIMLLMSVLFFIQSVKEHGLRKTLEDFILKYRSEKYRIEELEKGESSSAQSISSIVPEYEFSEKENTVVQVGEKDMQEYIQSFEDCALDRVLDKFLSGQIPLPSHLTATPTDVVADYDISSDYILEYGKLIDEANNLREKYKLSDDLDVKSVFEEVEKICLENQKSISDFKDKFKKELKNEEKSE
ncbi:hypothetical protein NP308_22340 [Salmonella enterica]|nr:hypothetical protein [Salmonella enterica]